jgi:hypothetical protein
VAFFCSYKIQFIYDEGMLNHDAPQKLIEGWLEFHRSNLCQSVDAVFVFNKQGVEIWCLSKNERNYQKLRLLFEPLQGSYRVEIYATRPPAPEDSAEDSELPPSLYENQELRDYLHVPIRSQPSVAIDEEVDSMLGHEVLKQRLISYAERVLSWNSRMKQYAADLPELVQTALNSGFPVELRMRASTVCAVHAKDLLENIRKLDKNLTHAIPKSSQVNASAKTESIEKEKLSILEQAEHVSGMTNESAKLIYNFIYPNQHSVDLSDLRQPQILDSLKKLETTVQNFQKEVSKLPASQRPR